jgi:hypothetical protein
MNLYGEEEVSLRSVQALNRLNRKNNGPYALVTSFAQIVVRTGCIACGAFSPEFWIWLFDPWQIWSGQKCDLKRLALDTSSHIKRNQTSRRNAVGGGNPNAGGTGMNCVHKQ